MTDEQRLLRAFVALEHDSDFKVIMDWHRERLNASRQSNDTMKDDIVFRWNQGRAQELADIIGKAETARKNLK